MTGTNLAHLQPPVVEPFDTWPEFRNIIDVAVDTQPRNLQVRIGPSEIGTECDRCLIHRLSGQVEAREPGTQWLPFIGTSVHAQLADFFVHANSQLPRARFLVESEVSVGEIDGEEITGHADLFDLWTGTVWDWKIVGKTTLEKAQRAGDVGEKYRVQGHLYGRGFARRGLRVNTVTVAMLPRNAVSLDSAYRWSEPYDEGVAIAALERATRLRRFIRLLGRDRVLADAPPHTGEEYSCARYPNPDGTYPLLPGHASPESAFRDIMGG